MVFFIVAVDTLLNVRFSNGLQVQRKRNDPSVENPSTSIAIK